MFSTQCWWWSGVARRGWWTEQTEKHYQLQHEELPEPLLWPHIAKTHPCTFSSLHTAEYLVGSCFTENSGDRELACRIIMWTETGAPTWSRLAKQPCQERVLDWGLKLVHPPSLAECWLAYVLADKSSKFFSQIHSWQGFMLFCLTRSLILISFVTFCSSGWGHFGRVSFLEYISKKSLENWKLKIE